MKCLNVLTSTLCQGLCMACLLSSSSVFTGFPVASTRFESFLLGVRSCQLSFITIISPFQHHAHLHLFFEALHSSYPFTTHNSHCKCAYVNEVQSSFCLSYNRSRLSYSSFILLAIYSNRIRFHYIDFLRNCFSFY